VPNGFTPGRSRTTKVNPPIYILGLMIVKGATRKEAHSGHMLETVRDTCVWLTERRWFFMVDSIFCGNSDGKDNVNDDWIKPENREIMWKSEKCLKVKRKKHWRTNNKCRNKLSYNTIKLSKKWKKNCNEGSFKKEPKWW